MKRISFLILFLTGCTHPKTNIGMVHDFIIKKAQSKCESHEGLHYIVSVQTIFKEKEDSNTDLKDYPCVEVYKFRCQDQSLFTYRDGIAFCFIPKAQLDESLSASDKLR